MGDVACSVDIGSMQCSVLREWKKDPQHSEWRHRVTERHKECASDNTIQATIASSVSLFGVSGRAQSAFTVDSPFPGSIWYSHQCYSVALATRMLVHIGLPRFSLGREYYKDIVDGLVVFLGYLSLP